MPLPVPNRSRNQDGTFRKKRSDTDANTLKKTYDGDIPSKSPKEHLGTILQKTNQPSLNKLVHSPKKGK